MLILVFILHSLDFSLHNKLLKEYIVMAMDEFHLNTIIHLFAKSYW